MQVEGQDGSRISIEPNCETVLGRGTGIVTDDRTLSRRHLLLELKTPSDAQTEPRVSFRVLGKNPIWVRTQKNGAIRAFKSGERSEVLAGDGLCLSSRHPVWYTLKRREIGSEESETSGSESGNGSDSFDIADIDPAKEFGFLVMGKEFERYPKNRIRDIRNWDWFLDEHREDSGDHDSDEDDGGRRVKKGLGKKRKKGKAHKKDDNDDEDNDWAGESEGEMEASAKTRRDQKRTYSTRSKDRGKPKKEAKKSGRAIGSDEEEDFEEDDETLGGFIVGDDDVKEEEETEPGGETEEEEFEDDDEDEED